ncbi:hypothetical protein [Desulfurobacterium sp.]
MKRFLKNLKKELKKRLKKRYYFEICHNGGGYAYARLRGWHTLDRRRSHWDNTQYHDVVIAETSLTAYTVRGAWKELAKDPDWDDWRKEAFCLRSISI